MELFKAEKQKILDLMEEFSHEISDNLKDDIIAKLSLLTPKVQELEWEQDPYGLHSTCDIFSIYDIFSQGKETFQVTLSSTMGEPLEALENAVKLGIYKSLEKAKDICQEHYNQQILGGLK